MSRLVQAAAALTAVFALSGCSDRPSSKVVKVLFSCNDSSRSSEVWQVVTRASVDTTSGVVSAADTSFFFSVERYSTNYKTVVSESDIVRARGEGLQYCQDDILPDFSSYGIQ